MHKWWHWKIQNITVFSLPVFKVSKEIFIHLKKKQKNNNKTVRLRFDNFAKISQFWWNLINFLTYANLFKRLKLVKLWVLDLADMSIVANLAVQLVNIGWWPHNRLFVFNHNRYYVPWVSLAAFLNHSSALSLYIGVSAQTAKPTPL